MRRLALTSLILFVAATAGLRAQGTEGGYEAVLAPGDSVVPLTGSFILDGSVRLINSKTGESLPTDAFEVDQVNRRIVIKPSYRESVSSDTVHLAVRYRYLPLSIPDEYFTRELVETVDSAGERQVEVASRGGSEPLTATSIFGRDFQRSGSITRGISIGSNRDLTVESGLRLQFNGKISDDVEVLGALTDEETPIQPEGTTRTIREVDNIFFEVRSPVADGTLGKFYASDSRSRYTGFNRKFQGVQSTGKFGAVGRTHFVAAVSPGRFRTQEIQGREGDQGPYRLTGPSGDRNIVVVAGTEKVFVNGVEMIRGRENDYIIDYGTGEITFQPKRPISGFDEIVIDFEFTDRRFSRSFVSGSHATWFADSSVSISGSFVREADDPDSPVDIELDEEDRELLAAAGDDQSMAVRSGARLVGRSDTAQGFYRVVDTVIDGVPDSIFVYDPASDLAVYDVSFSRALDGVGDYQSVAFGQYEYVGEGNGEYLPVTYLPFAGLQQVGALNVRIQPSDGLALSGEVALSNTDVNRFSSASETSQNGIGFNGRIDAKNDSMQIAGLNLGSIAFSSDIESVSQRFRPVSRIGDAEFDRDWNTSGRIGEVGTGDLVSRSRMTWSPVSRLDLRAGIGYLDRGAAFNSFRQEYGFEYGSTDFPLRLDGFVERIASSDMASGGVESTWLKGRGGVSYRADWLTPAVRVEAQTRDDLRAGADTLLRGTFQFVEFGPEVKVNLPLFRTTAAARFRVDDSARYDPEFGRTRVMGDGTTQSLSVSGLLTGVRNVRSQIDLTWRHRRYDSVPGVDPASRLDNVTILARSESRISALDKGLEIEAVYDVQTERAARLQRLFVQVPVGQGQYVWVDSDSNDVQSEDEFRETIAQDGNYVRITLPTDELFPVVDLESTLRFTVSPEKFLSDTTWLGNLLKPVTTETFLRLEEKSNTDDEAEIYLLNLSEFQNDSTTLLGNALVQQDVHLFRGSRSFSMRGRLLLRQGMTRLYNDLERSKSVERSLRLQWNPTVDIGFQFDGAIENRSLLGDRLDDSRAYDLDALRAESDFSYRPERDLELGWRFTIRSADDAVTTPVRSTLLTSNEIRGIYSIETKGRLRASLERSVVAGTNVGEGDLFSLPFQLTDGYGIGTTWVGRLSFDYRIGAHIQASVSYTGRSDPPSNRVVHIGQTSVRAFF